MADDTAIRNRAWQDAVEHALDDGTVREIPATHVDPACLDRDVDIYIIPIEVILGYVADANVTARVGSTVVFERRYRLDTHIEWESL